jgi:hypothetical protein
MVRSYPASRRLHSARCGTARRAQRDLDVAKATCLKMVAAAQSNVSYRALWFERSA